MMYRLKRVRIYKIIFDKSLWVSVQEVEERAVILTGLAVERQMFFQLAWLDLPLGSVRRKNPKGEKRKNNGSFIIINKNRSAERKCGPVRSTTSFPGACVLFIYRAAQIHEKIADAS